MSKSLIPKICEMLGVKPDEEFKIDNYGNRIFKFSIDSLYEKREEGFNENQHIEWYQNLLCLKYLLNGNATVIKLPLYPKLNVKYWTFCSDKQGNLSVTWDYWDNAPVDFALFKSGWVYKSKEEALKNLPKVFNEYPMQYSLPNTSHEED